MIGDRNNVLILGNGFDIDLGLQTTYGAFMKSSWPFTEETDGLAKFLRDKFKDQNWIDFEHSFLEYIAGNRFPDEYKKDKDRDCSQHACRGNHRGTLKVTESKRFPTECKGCTRRRKDCRRDTCQD